MKGLITSALIALFYLLVILFFHHALAEPRGVTEGKNVGQPDSGEQSVKPELAGNGAKNGTGKDAHAEPAAKFGNDATNKVPSQKGGLSDPHVMHAQQRAAPNNPANDSNPLADLFQITDPNMRTALGALYGSFRGNDQCQRKAFCIMGNYMRDMPGRDLLFLFMGNYIPTEYSLYYEIFKVAVQYGQNCDVYVCVPDSDTPTDAASAARPGFSFFSPASTTTTSTSTTTPAPQTQQQQRVQQQNSQQRMPQRPPSLDDAFGNNIPR